MNEKHTYYDIYNGEFNSTLQSAINSVLKSNKYGDFFTITKNRNLFKLFASTYSGSGEPVHYNISENLDFTKINHSGKLIIGDDKNSSLSLSNIQIKIVEPIQAHSIHVIQSGNSKASINNDGSAKFSGKINSAGLEFDNASNVLSIGESITFHENVENSITIKEVFAPQLSGTTEELSKLGKNDKRLVTQYELKSLATGALKFKKTCVFEDLPKTGNLGDMYNISNNFTIDGLEYPAGTNVAWSSENKWDPLGGSTGTFLTKSSAESLYLAKAGGEMTGTIKKDFRSYNNPLLQVVAGDYLSDILRISANGINNLKSDFGFSIKYNGPGTGIENSLQIYADNKQAASQVLGLDINQSGNIGIKTKGSDIYSLNINGNENIAGSLFFSNTNSEIQFNGNKKATSMIRFIDNTENTYGNGISIGGGGSTIIGGGESSTFLQGQIGSSGGSEKLILSNDNNIDFYANCDGNDINKTAHMVFKSTGDLSIPKAVSIESGKATMEYNTTDECIEFIFA